MKMRIAIVAHHALGGSGVMAVEWAHLLARRGHDVHLVRFGQVTLIDWLDTEDVYDPKTTTDASFTARVSPNVSLTLGGANLFNVYPTQQDTETETGTEYGDLGYR